jgi:FixJ family two-component response regulator
MCRRWCQILRTEAAALTLRRKYFWPSVRESRFNVSGSRSLTGPAKIMGDAVFLVDATPAERSQIECALANEHVCLEFYDSAESFLDQATARLSGCVLVPSDLSGMGVRALINEIFLRDLPLAVIIICDKPDLATAVELVRAGATDFLECPISDRELRSVVRRAIGTDR